MIDYKVIRYNNLTRKEENSKAVERVGSPSGRRYELFSNVRNKTYKRRGGYGKTNKKEGGRKTSYCG